MWWTVVKQAAANWSSDKDARQGAALAYYSVFSLGPIIVIAIAIRQRQRVSEVARSR
jgi:membrane protein